MSEKLIGKEIGKYVIKEHLGKGGMAEVYKGYQENLDRFVAIKLMHTFLVTEEDFISRFKREAKAMAALNHPNIVGVYDFDQYSTNSYYLVMEYISGGTLKDHLTGLAKNGQRMPLETAVKYIIQISDALAYAHKRNMIHRDIKPANIMLDKEHDKAILTDFGIVKMVGNQSMAFTATGALIGTPAYMSPEQALGKPGDERVDIYSLGVLLFHMVTGQLPFDADTPLAVVLKHVNEQPPLPMSILPEIPNELQEVIMKALAKEPDERFQTAAEMGKSLRGLNLNGPVATSMGKATLKTTGTVVLSDPEADHELPGTTAVGSAAPISDTGTRVQQTAVVHPPATTSQPPAKRGPLLYAGLGLVGLIIIFGILYATGVFSSTSATPTPNQAAIVENDEEEATATPEAEEETAVPSNTPLPNVAATNVALLAADLTSEAKPTNTPRPTATRKPSPTPTATIDPTSQFLTVCAKGIELVLASRENSTSNGVTAGFGFTASWQLRNSGECPWPADLVWAYVSGETFGYDDGPIPLDQELLTGEELNLTARFTAPNAIGTFESTWQLQTASGASFAAPVTFSFRTFPLATATPLPTATPVATATPETIVGQAAWIFTVGICDYPGDGPDWRCEVTLFPYIDGSDQIGQFTINVFDQPGGQATTYRGAGPFTHFVSARRCAAYNSGIRIVDDLTVTQLDDVLYIDPDNYFAGGCVEN